MAWWRYRKGPKGRFEGRIFYEGQKIPESWVDTPAKLAGWVPGESAVFRLPDLPKVEVKNDDGA